MGDVMDDVLESFGVEYGAVDPDRPARIRLRNLATGAMPNLTFLPGNTQSNHTSGHQNIEHETTHQQIPVAQVLIDSLMNRCVFLEEASDYLKEVDGKPNFHYSSEADVVKLVGLLLGDVLKLTLLGNRISAHQETYVPHARYLGRGGHRSDFWLILVGNTPLMVVEVKSPHIPNVLLDPAVVGQITDYMLDIASFYGQRDVFGVTTDGKHWKFHWLPSSNASAHSTVFQAQRNTVLNDDMPAYTRNVFSTDLIPHNHPQLVRLLITAVWKCFASPRYAVPLISPNRVYITLLENSWAWSRLSNEVAGMQSLSIDFTGQAARSSQFVVLNHMERNKNQLVWIALAGSTSRIVVIKQFVLEHADKAEQERTIWQTVNQFEVFVKTIRGLKALIMPLVFHMHVQQNGAPALSTDLVSWLFPTGAAGAAIPAFLNQLQQQITVAAAQWPNMHIIAENAIAKMAARRVVHNDIAWRHFGLAPIFARGAFVGLEPVMIDFSDCERVTSRQIAQDRMTARLNALIAAVPP